MNFLDEVFHACFLPLWKNINVRTYASAQELEIAMR